MAIKRESKEIDGSTYLVFQHDPFEAVIFYAKVLKVLGPVLGALGKQEVSKLKSLMDDDEKEKKDTTGLELSVLAEVASSIDEDKLGSLLKSCVLSGKVHKDGKPITDMNVSFMDEGPLTLIKVAVFVIQVNFKDFFAKLGFSMKKKVTEDPK